MKVIKQKKALLFRPECLPSTCYIELRYPKLKDSIMIRFKLHIIIIKIWKLNIDWIYKVCLYCR